MSEEQGKVKYQNAKCKMTDEVLRKILEKIDIMNRRDDRGFRSFDSYRFVIDGEDFFLLDVIETFRARIAELEKERQAMGEVIHAVELLERTRGGMDLPFGFKDAQINKACVNLGQVFNHYLSSQSPAEGKEPPEAHVAATIKQWYLANPPG